MHTALWPVKPLPRGRGNSLVLLCSYTGTERSRERWQMGGAQFPTAGMETGQREKQDPQGNDYRLYH